MSLIKGIHHVAIAAKSMEQYNKTVDFYCNILGMPVIRKWGSGESLGLMADTGAGVMEIFSLGDNPEAEGALKHIAFDVASADDCVNAVRNAGYQITVEPKDITIAADKPISARIAFCIGPVGEIIEFFQTY